MLLKNKMRPGEPFAEASGWPSKTINERRMWLSLKGSQCQPSWGRGESAQADHWVSEIITSTCRAKEQECHQKWIPAETPSPMWEAKVSPSEFRPSEEREKRVQRQELRDLCFNTEKFQWS